MMKNDNSIEIYGTKNTDTKVIRSTVITPSNQLPKRSSYRFEIDQELMCHWLVCFTFLIIPAIYLTGIQANSIWTTHESYYAVAVREMLESGDWLNITFNYEPRLNKPPLTYWLMAVSAKIFGLQEWALRLPIVLLSIGTIGLVYLLGKLLYNQWIGWLAMIMMTVSLQFVWLKHYASPEIPLTFFFSLTLYLFLLGNKTGKGKYLIGGYIACGLTVLTKGYPYYLIIGAIIFLYLLQSSQFRWEKLKYAAHKLHWQTGIPLMLFIGSSWLIYGYFVHKDIFLETLHFETTQRAFAQNSESSWLRNLFFYPEVILWSFFPFSLIFYMVFIQYLWSGKWKEVSLPMAWLFVMLLVFTIAQGKLPAYILQAHPPMALLVSHWVINYNPITKWEKLLLKVSINFPLIISIFASLSIVVLFHLSSWFYVTIILTIGVIIYLKRNAVYFFQVRGILTNSLAMGLVIWIMFAGLYPCLEQFRPYRAIQGAITKSNISAEIPLLMEERFVHNLPFYTKRKLMRDRLYSWEDIQHFRPKGPTLALITTQHKVPQRFQVLWKGYLYKKGSESHGFQFITRSWMALAGNFKHFTEYQLIYHDPFTSKPNRIESNRTRKQQL